MALWGDNAYNAPVFVPDHNMALFLKTGYTVLVLKAGSKVDTQFRNRTGARAVDFGAGKKF